MNSITVQFKSQEAVLGRRCLDGSISVNVLLSGTRRQCSIHVHVQMSVTQMSVADTRRSDSLRQLDLTTARISVII